MSHQKIVVVESEKSPKICSTNWKEDLVLKRNLQVLDRSEHTVVNRITVDQKILFRRFQTKLGRSKMSYARAMGNVEMQKKLRAKTTFVLNTNIGRAENQDETLNRLWTSGRRSYEERISADNFPNRRQIGAFTSIEADTAVVPTPKKQEIPEKTLVAVNVRPSTAVTIANPHSQRRPGTSIEIRPRSRPAVPPTEDHSTDDCYDTSSATVKDDAPSTVPGKKQRPQTAKATLQEDEDTVYEVVSGKKRPKTAGAYIQTTTLAEVSKSGKSGGSTARHSTKPTAPSSAPSGTGGNAGIGSMFKSNAFEISLVDFQRFLVHSAHYEDKVKRYGERVSPFKADSAHSVDYYTAKLQAAVREVNKKNIAMEAATDATPEDIKRATGNLNIKNLTLRQVEDSNTSHKSEISVC